jgi:hypothetical protein
MNNNSYKKKYLKYKTKYNNLKLYGGDPKIIAEANKKVDEIKEVCNIQKLCKTEPNNKDNCINEEDDLINNCKNKIIEFELNYINQPTLLDENKKKEYQLQIQDIMNNLNFYKLTRACKINSNKRMVSPTECQKMLSKLKPSLAASVSKAAASTLDDASKAAASVLDDMASLFSWGGGGLTPQQLKVIDDIEKNLKGINNTYPISVNISFSNLFDNFSNLSQGVLSNLTSLVGTTVDVIKKSSTYITKKNKIMNRLKILEENKVYLNEEIQSSREIDLNKLKLEKIIENIKIEEEELKDLDSPFELLTLGLLDKISSIASNPLEKIKEICKNYFLSSLELVEIANDLHNYISIIDKYILKIKPDNEYKRKLLMKLNNYKQEIINLTTQIKLFVTSQIDNIGNIDKELKEPVKSKSANTTATNNFKITLELSLEPKKTIKKANKIIDKLHRIFIIIDTNSYPSEPFIDFKENDVVSGFKKVVR